MDNIEILKEKVIQVSKNIYDPEIPVNIYESLGLIYDIQIAENNDVVVLMTLTAPNCPEAGSLPNELGEAVKEIEGIGEVKIFLTFDPPWDRERLSEEAKLVLGMF